MKRLWLIGVLCGVMGGACAETNFSARFDAYAPLEALSAKGADGGTWRLSSGTCAARVDESRSAMALDGRADFTATSVSAENFESIDFSFQVDELELGTPAPAEGLGGFSAGRSREAAGYYGWGDGRWNFLTADGCEPTIGAWVEARLETKTIDSFRFLSYLVKAADGAYVRCADAAGRT